MTDKRSMEILSTLRKTFDMSRLTMSIDDPFKTLVVTMISQNTAGRNTAKAFESLSNKFKIVPEVLANTETSQIEESLKVAGLYRNKAKAIREASRMIVEKHQGRLDSIMALPLGEAREQLLELPGVGPKTADVLLLFCAKKPIIPVDTHVNRVAKRLRLAPERGKYETVRKSLESLYDPKDYLAIHVLLISHGRRFCKARAPLCKLCPIRESCPSRHLWDKDD